MVEILFGMVLPWVLVGLLCWFGYQLILQNGRVLLRLDEITARLDKLATAGGPAPVPDGPPPGLAVGAAAPAFDLPDLDGKRHTLAQYRGRRVIVAFYSTQCGFCTDMLPRLAAQA